MIASTRTLTVAQRTGLRYERKVEVALCHLAERLHIGVEFQPVFHYEDSSGPRTCIPDFLLLWPDFTVVGETKLTWVQDAQDKLQRLYMPLVQGCHPGPIKGLIVCRSLTPDAIFTSILQSISDIHSTPMDSISSLGWRGRGGIV